MVKFTILAGGYTSFIATYLFDSSSSTLTLQSQSQTGPKPSWITLNKANSSILYAVNDLAVVNDGAAGAIQSFIIKPDGSLSSAVDTAPSSGDNPAHATALSSGQVVVMNYSSGNGRIIPTGSDGLHFNQSAGVITFPAPASGQISHPHMALQYKKEVLVPDLSGDKIWRLVQNTSPGDWKIQGLIAQPAGSGPRHIAIHDEYLYTLHELSSTLSVQAIPAAPNATSSFISNVSTLPSASERPAGAAYAAAEILIPPPTSAFPNPYIYVSNRNTGSGQGNDTIAIFEHVQGPKPGLKLVKQVYTGLAQPRGMEIGGNQEYLVASGVEGTGGVVVFKRTEGGRNLVEVARNLEIPTRTTFIWRS